MSNQLLFILNQKQDEVEDSLLIRKGNPNFRENNYFTSGGNNISTSTKSNLILDAHHSRSVIPQPASEKKIINRKAPIYNNQETKKKRPQTADPSKQSSQVNTTFTTVTSTTKSVKSNKIAKQNSMQMYISPFIRKANELANERSKIAIEKIKQQRFENLNQKHKNNDGKNNNIMMDFNVSNSLFDPDLRKQEIFRLEPKNQQQQDIIRQSSESRRSNARPSNAASSIKNESVKKSANGMTKRTFGETPHRAPKVENINTSNISTARVSVAAEENVSNQIRTSINKLSMDADMKQTSQQSVVQSTQKTATVSVRTSEQPQQSRQQSQSKQSMVTRSTSPIDQQIIDKILYETTTMNQQALLNKYAQQQHVPRQPYPYQMMDATGVSGLVHGLGNVMQAVGGIVRDTQTSRYHPTKRTSRSISRQKAQQQQPLQSQQSQTTEMPYVVNMNNKETEPVIMSCTYSKTVVLDMMLQKLQDIKRSEDEVLQFMYSQDRDKNSAAIKAQRTTPLSVVTALPKPIYTLNNTTMSAATTGTHGHALQKQYNNKQFMGVSKAIPSSSSSSSALINAYYSHKTTHQNIEPGFTLSKTSPINRTFMYTPKVESTFETAASASSTTSNSRKDHLRAYDSKLYSKPSTHVMESSATQVDSSTDDLTKQILTRQRHPDYPCLRPSFDVEQEVFEYKRQLKIAKDLREAAFRAHGVSLADMVVRISDTIVEDSIKEVMYEVNEFFEEFSEKIIDTI